MCINCHYNTVYQEIYVLLNICETEDYKDFAGKNLRFSVIAREKSETVKQYGRRAAFSWAVNISYPRQALFELRSASSSKTRFTALLASSIVEDGTTADSGPAGSGKRGLFSGLKYLCIDIFLSRLALTTNTLLRAR